MITHQSTTELPKDFHPGDFDVICARGKQAKNHAGNKYYRSLINQAMEQYSQAKNKYEKTLIVSSIVDEVRERSPGGGFVKQESDGFWHEVGDHLAREKVGQNLRDGLSKQYKSSTKAKRRRREVMSADLAEDVETMIQSSKIVSTRINNLQTKIQSNGDIVPEVFVANMFTQANLEILEAFKGRPSLVQKFEKAEKSHKTSAAL